MAEKMKILVKGCVVLHEVDFPGFISNAENWKRFENHFVHGMNGLDKFLESTISSLYVAFGGVA
jgi:hypothetical protein